MEVADILGIVGAALGLIGVLLALAVPLSVEWSRRPSLRIEKGLDGNSDDPFWRIVHVQVVNEPLTGRRARWLLRNPAAGCQVAIDFVSRSDGTRIQIRGKWSARPEPLAPVPVTGRAYGLLVDPTKIPPSLTLDVSPSLEGEPVAVAIKHNNDSQAYAFDPEIYVHGNLRNPELALPHEEYEVTVRAQAGEVSAEPRRFLLRNGGTSPRDLRLEPIDS